MSKIKGQNFVTSASIVANETNCTVTVTGNTEDVSDKSATGLYSKESVVSTSWQVQTDTYQSEPEQLKAILNTFNAAASIAVGWSADGASGISKSGQALLNDFVMNFNDRETVNVSLQFQGTGALS